MIKLSFYYSFQLQCADEQLEDFEKEYFLLLEYISLELGDLANLKPVETVENSIELVKGYFNEWIFNYAAKEV